MIMPSAKLSGPRAPLAGQGDTHVFLSGAPAGQFPENRRLADMGVD
jgi:hypothetical protein